MIRLVGVEKKLGGQPVLQGVDLSIPVGKLTTIIGGSGSGKSVLLKHMIGLMQPDRGEVWVGDVEISRLSGTPLERCAETVRDALSGRRVVRLALGL